MCSDQNDTKTMKPRRAYNHYHQSFYVAISVFLRWFSFVSISINPWEISFLSSRVCYPSSIYLITGSQPLCRCPPMEKHSIIIFFKTLLTDYFHQSVFFFRKAPARINNLYFPESNLIQSFQPWVKKKIKNKKGTNFYLAWLYHVLKSTWCFSTHITILYAYIYTKTNQLQTNSDTSRNNSSLSWFI